MSGDMKPTLREKSLKVKVDTYDRLDAIGKRDFRFRDSFDDIINVCIDAYDAARKK